MEEDQDYREYLVITAHGNKKEVLLCHTTLAILACQGSIAPELLDWSKP